MVAGALGIGERIALQQHRDVVSVDHDSCGMHGVVRGQDDRRDYHGRLNGYACRVDDRLDVAHRRGEPFGDEKDHVSRGCGDGGTQGGGRTTVVVDDGDV